MLQCGFVRSNLSFAIVRQTPLFLDPIQVLNKLFPWEYRRLKPTNSSTPSTIEQLTGTTSTIAFQWDHLPKVIKCRRPPLALSYLFGPATVSPVFRYKRRHSRYLIGQKTFPTIASKSFWSG